MLEKLLKERKLPPLKSKQEMMHILMEEEYGFMPPKPDSMNYAVTDDYIPGFCAG